MSKETYPLSTIRHSASHVLAQAVQKKFPDAKLAIGPAIDEGFYYDFDLPRTLTPEDLVEIEADMKQIISEKQVFEQSDKSREETLAIIQDTKQDYKKEIVDDLDLDEYSFYTNGPFSDLCRGPHVAHTGEIGAVKLLRVSGAYWRGSEDKAMLQRIYGTAFTNEKQLRIHLKRLEEAKKRDHRVLGKEQDLFSISEDVGGGLIMWHPKGAKIRYLIEEFWRKAHFDADYDLLYSPHIGKSKLWETSGHLDFYKENMFAPVDIENSTYYVKPMNCPFHIDIYKDRQWSYRDLPLRWAELGTVYRYERSGTLHGLMRVRGFTQDDAHIFCTPEQMNEEVQVVIKLCLDVLKTFQFTDYKIYLSTRPKDKYVGEIAEWDTAEAALKKSIEELGIKYEVDEGGGAFYGPKIDIKIEDAIGRQWQCSTIQFDFNLPERFDLTYIGSDGQKHRPYMIHRALLGSVERFFGILIEHYAGKFPTWLAPIQVKILAIHESGHDHCKALATTLKKAGCRVEVDFSSEKLGYKIREARNEKVPYMAIIGKSEIEENTISLRSRDDGDQGSVSVDDLIATLTKSSPE
ncbi:threonine--tRNA ligase [bacterium]|jgi:threonyl-tRNA synthetase|nr:threonine--tRNA ligase [bacterium]